MIVVASISLFLFLSSYFLYPIIIIFFSALKKSSTANDVLAFYTIQLIIPIHNEEKIIKQKLDSIVNSDYPTDKMQIHIGLDACTDNSKQIINQYIDILNINIHEFDIRNGKPNVLNHIVAKLEHNEDIILFSDADIVFEKNTISKINQAFQVEQVGLVDVLLQNKASNNIEENIYINFENKLKYAESILFAIFQGVSGACYAMRKKYFKPIPKHFLVDDYFISMQVFIQNGKGVFLDNSVVYENRRTSVREEFSRKTRIASGNFQNAWYLKKYLLNPFNKLGFTFFFHKFLRWLSPLFLTIILMYLLINYTLIIFVLTLIFIMLAFLLHIFGIRNNPIKMVAYFWLMQWAILLGFIKFLKGIKSNIWQPTPKTI